MRKMRYKFINFLAKNCILQQNPLIPGQFRKFSIIWIVLLIIISLVREDLLFDNHIAYNNFFCWFYINNILKINFTKC
jgi:hypothetical protein